MVRFRQHRPRRARRSSRRWRGRMPATPPPTAPTRRWSGCAARIREIFEAPEAAVYLVATGTAANALSLACLCPPWATVYCHRDAHVAEDECGAPEFYTGGAKLTLLDGDARAQIAPESLERAMARPRQGRAQRAEGGAVADQRHRGGDGLRARRRWRGSRASPSARGAAGAHGRGALRQRAGRRSAARPAELTWKAGVDVLSFGGTKNGCLGVEAVMLFDPARAWEFELRRKRGGHLFSKHRYLSAQMEAYLADGLWLDLAEAANARARELARGHRRAAGRGAGASERGQRGLRLPGRGPGTGRPGGGGALLSLAGRTRAWKGRRRSRCRRGSSATGRRRRRRWRSFSACSGGAAGRLSASAEAGIPLRRNG